MRYLSISKTPYYVAYALFQDKSLELYGKTTFNSETPSKRIVELYSTINDLIEHHKPNFILTHLINKERVLKENLDKIIELRTILRLVCSLKNVMYNEFKTSGWEKRITDNKPTVRKKLKIINEGYDININDVEIAEAIILAEGVAHNRLQIGE